MSEKIELTDTNPSSDAAIASMIRLRQTDLSFAVSTARRSLREYLEATR